MSEQLLTILKLCLLALLYLFFFRVLRAVWVEVNPPRALEGAGGGSAPAGGVPAAPTSRRKAKRLPSQLIVLEPAAQRGRAWPLASELTIGRAAGCHVAIPDDTFASQIHARVFQSDGQTWVEDLGSTNGTFVNRDRVTAATAVRRGDQVKVGNTVLELG
jgi:pSer/pThr/pTyr-binding forkhead associated (FHA) protein